MIIDICNYMQHFFFCLVIIFSLLFIDTNDNDDDYRFDSIRFDLDFFFSSKSIRWSIENHCIIDDYNDNDDDHNHRWKINQFISINWLFIFSSLLVVGHHRHHLYFLKSQNMSFCCLLHVFFLFSLYIFYYLMEESALDL